MFNNLLFIKGGIQHYQLDLLALNDTMGVYIYIYSTNLDWWNASYLPCLLRFSVNKQQHTNNVQAN